MKKRILSLLMVGAMTAGMLAGCGSKAPADNTAKEEIPATEEAKEETPATEEKEAVEPVTLNVAYMPNYGSLWSVENAIDQGYLEEEGITVNLVEFQDGPTIISAMESGSITTNRPASAMVAAGCETTIIGHCEERNDKAGILAEAGVTDTDAVNRLLNQEIKCAIERGMTVLYCIGEKSEEQDQWQEVLGKQLEIGLKDVDKSKVVIAYEPIWSIGPGKTPAGKDYITKIARFVKEQTGGMDIVYGGGLKQDNAAMLASIDEIDGGLIALTRFQGEIGYYPEEYLEIIRLYMGK